MIYLEAVKIIFILSIVFITATSATAQKSVIAALYDTFPSIVLIMTEAGGLFRTPGGQAVRDSKTGRVVVARKVMAGKYKREGAGVIIDSSGLIVTNAHNVSGAGRVTVRLYNDTKVSGQIVKIIPGDDIAFISIAPPYPLMPLNFADSNALKLRSKVYNIGTSELLRGTLSGGKVTGIGKKAKGKNKNKDFIDLIKTSFNVYKGDSGGPLLDNEGNLLGLIVATQVDENHSSYAIPSKVIQKYYIEYLEERMNGVR